MYYEIRVTLKDGQTVSVLQTHQEQKVAVWAMLMAIDESNPDVFKKCEVLKRRAFQALGEGEVVQEYPAEGSMG
jgi:cold shock CspA family protein